MRRSIAPLCISLNQFMSSFAMHSSACTNCAAAVADAAAVARDYDDEDDDNWYTS